MRWLQFLDGFHLLQDRINSLGRHHIAEQFSRGYTKHILFRVKHHLILTEIDEGLFEIVKQIPLLF
jgi:hypothetical protein